MDRELELGKDTTSDGKTLLLHLLNTLPSDTLPPPTPLKVAIKGSTYGG